MTPLEKLVAAVLLPAAAAVDWRWAAALAFGMVSGWFCRAAIPYMNRRPWADIRREFVVSVLISGGSLLATLKLAEMTRADELGVAFLAWGVSFGGLKGLSLAYSYVWQPIRTAIGKPVEEVMGERRQEAQKRISAARIALKEEKEKGDD